MLHFPISTQADVCAWELLATNSGASARIHPNAAAWPDLAELLCTSQDTPPPGAAVQAAPGAPVNTKGTSSSSNPGSSNVSTHGSGRSAAALSAAGSCSNGAGNRTAGWVGGGNQTCASAVSGAASGSGEAAAGAKTAGRVQDPGRQLAERLVDWQQLQLIVLVGL